MNNPIPDVVHKHKSMIDFREACVTAQFTYVYEVVISDKRRKDIQTLSGVHVDETGIGMGDVSQNYHKIFVIFEKRAYFVQYARGDTKKLKET